MKWLWLALAVAAQTVEETTGDTEIYENLILGVGPGTFAVIIAACVGVVICFFKDCVPMPNLCIAGGFAIPVLVFAIIRSLPVKSVSSDEARRDEVPTDFYVIRTILICSLIFVVAVALFLTVFCSNFTAQLIARRIDSQTLQMKQFNKIQDNINLVNQQAAMEQAQNEAQ